MGLLQRLWAYYRGCGLTTEAVGLLQRLWAYYRGCGLTTEAVGLLQRLWAYYRGSELTTEAMGLLQRLWAYYRGCGLTTEAVGLLQRLWAYYRGCGLTTEAVGLLQRLWAYYRGCGLTTEAVGLLQRLWAYYRGCRLTKEANVHISNSITMQGYLYTLAKPRQCSAYVVGRMERRHLSSQYSKLGSRPTLPGYQGESGPSQSESLVLVDLPFPSLETSPCWETSPCLETSLCWEMLKKTHTHTQTRTHTCYLRDGESLMYLCKRRASRLLRGNTIGRGVRTVPYISLYAHTNSPERFLWQAAYPTRTLPGRGNNEPQRYVAKFLKGQ